MVRLLSEDMLVRGVKDGLRWTGESIARAQARAPGGLTEVPIRSPPRASGAGRRRAHLRGEGGRAKSLDRLDRGLTVRLDDRD